MRTTDRARAFILKNARPLDAARWFYHFEGGGADDVLRALSAYQNTDGGFGHALEPDSWNPNSSPIQTWCATEILREIDFSGSGHPLVRGILTYLDSGADFKDGKWMNTVKSNEGFPHAPWWGCGAEDGVPDDNPTACLAGFALLHADKGSALHEKCAGIAARAAMEYIAGEPLQDMHTLACFLRLKEYADKAGEAGLFDFAAFERKLRENVRASITVDKEQWKTGYVCKPSQFFIGRDSEYYPDNREIAEYECEFIRETQLDDGSWLIPWSWGGYPEEWAVSQNWWKGNCAILNALYLRGNGCC